MAVYYSCYSYNNNSINNNNNDNDNNNNNNNSINNNNNDDNNNNNNNFFKTLLIQYKSKIDVQLLELFWSCVHSSRGQLRLLKKT